MNRRLLSLFALSLATFIAGCNGGKNQPNIELIQDMMDQISVKAQDSDPKRKNEFANHYPPEHTVPIGFKPYPYPGDPQAADKNLKNPHAGDFSAEFIELGKRKYEIYCLMCHGEHLTGDGPVGAKMLLKPPSLLSQKVRDFHDGHIFHIISQGQGLMGAYATQIHNVKDRWAIVNYVRSIEKKTDVKN